MKAITLRNLPPQLARKLEEEATETGASLNKTVIRLLCRATGVGETPQSGPRFHDLDFLAGTWRDDEAAELDQRLFEQRRIDPEIWD